MTRRSPFALLSHILGTLLLLAVVGIAVVANSAQAGEEPTEPSAEYIVLDAPAGTSRAVVVQGQALVHTRQLLPLDHQGQLVGGGAIDLQIEQVLDNLGAALEAAGSGWDRLVRVNIYALAASTTERVREQLSKRLDAAVRPALTSVLTPLPHRDTLVAVDAVAVAVGKGEQVTLSRCEAVSGVEGCADTAILPRGGVAYLSGVAAEGGLTESAVDKSMAGLTRMLQDLKLSSQHVVQLKVFLRPASSADEVLEKLKAYFPNQMTPPVTFVEWLAPPPVEIEMIAQFPWSSESSAAVEYYNPPEVSRLQVFSRACLVHSDRQIYVAGLFARQAGGGQEQALDVFDQLQAILAKTGSDLRHLAKGTYYVCDDDSARGMDRARLWLYDQDRPPAASKCMVHGVGEPQRTLTMDLIAVGAGK